MTIVPWGGPTRLKSCLPGLRKHALEIVLLLYGAVNACLYSALLPLWDGFDEPFHYAYVHHLRTAGTLPVFGQTPISGEIARSLRLAPASYLVKRNIPWVTTFEEYFALPAEERVARRRQLEAVDPRAQDAGGLNYEAQQAPL